MDVWRAVLGSAGGVGLFLFGMVTLTEGLRALAGDSLRRGIARFTRSPTSGALCGAVGTALIQSSSATTVAAIGFVGAGLMTFPQALGVIFGANVGTTATGWIVGLLGFRLGLLDALWPAVFVAALVLVLARDRFAAPARALLGFALVFVGLAYLEGGLAGFTLTPESFPDDTIAGRGLLVLLGLAITLITQSSSAGVAAAMAAVLAEKIDLRQAAAMVIGMDVGTTVTALLAGLGGNVAARRTGLAHVVYNVTTGVAAFALLPLYFIAWDRLGRPGADQPQLVVVAFHSLFNGLGVVAILPFTGWFARRMERIVPDREEGVSGELPRALQGLPDAALDALAGATARRACALLDLVSTTLHGGRGSVPSALRADVEYMRAYLHGIASAAAREARPIANIRLLDHLERLADRLERTNVGAALAGDPEIGEWARPLARFVERARASFARAACPPDLEEEARAVWEELEGRREARRLRLIEAGLSSAADDAQAATALDRSLDAHRWLRRTAYHCWRVVVWWRVAAGLSPVEDPAPVEDPD